MKPFESWTSRYQWKCIWKSCGWEAFDNGDGKLHWFTRWQPQKQDWMQHLR